MILLRAAISNDSCWWYNFGRVAQETKIDLIKIGEKDGQEQEK
jgi:hypothetical protein